MSRTQFTFLRMGITLLVINKKKTTGFIPIRRIVTSMREIG